MPSPTRRASTARCHSRSRKRLPAAAIGSTRVNAGLRTRTRRWRAWPVQLRNGPTIGAPPGVPYEHDGTAGVGRKPPPRPVVLLEAVSYTHLRAHETPEHLVCR